MMRHIVRRWFGAAVLASAAWAAVDTGWIEKAGGSVTRDAAGQPVAVDLRASWATDSDMPLLVQLKELKRLDLSLTRISDRGLRRLKSAAVHRRAESQFRRADYG